MNYCLYSLRFAFNRKVIEYENSSIKKVYDIFLSLRKNVVNSMNTAASKTKFQASANDPIIEFPDSAYDLLKCLLEMDCEKRVTAADALKHSFFQGP